MTCGQPLIFLLCDVQYAFKDKIHKMNEIIYNTKRMINASKIMNIPLLVTEQVPSKLGATIQELSLPASVKPIPKSSFSMLKSSQFMYQYEQLISKQTKSVNSSTADHSWNNTLKQYANVVNRNRPNAIQFDNNANANRLSPVSPINASGSENPRNAMVALFGIESHVCILQTAADLRMRNDEVFVITDCVSSRSPHEIPIAFSFMESIGCTLTTSESFIFSLLGSSDHESFKEISALFK